MERHKLCLNRHVLSFIRHSTGLGQRSSITRTRTSPHLTSPTCTWPARLPISLEISSVRTRISPRCRPAIHERTASTRRLTQSKSNPLTDSTHHHSFPRYRSTSARGALAEPCPARTPLPTRLSPAESLSPTALPRL
jgi:hypothetical protein